MARWRGDLKISLRVNIASKKTSGGLQRGIFVREQEAFCLFCLTRSSLCEAPWDKILVTWLLFPGLAYFSCCM